MFKSKLFFLFFVATIFQACTSENEMLGPEEDQIKNYIKAKKIIVTDSSTVGLRFILTEKNSSGAKLMAGQSVKVNYNGKFIAGKKKDKSFDAGTFNFTLGQKEVVDGFDMGIAKMKVGEKATLIFLSSLGYGSKGQGSIPANTPLLFEIEVISAR